MKRGVALFALVIMLLSSVSFVLAQNDSEDQKDGRKDRLRDRIKEVRTEKAEAVRARIADARSDVAQRIKEARMKARRALAERIGDENFIQDADEKRIIYRTDKPEMIEKYKRFCTARGGTFSECGSPCKEGDVCPALCVPTCEGITKRAKEVEDRIQKELRIREKENGKRIHYRAKVGEAARAVTIDVQEGEDGVERKLIRFKSEKGDHKVVRTKLILKDAEGKEGTFVKVVRSDGVEREVKVTPERVRAAALKRLQAADAAIELRETREEGKPRLVYDVATDKRARFLGIFGMKMRMNAEVDPETGEIIRVKKPWWAFLAAGEDDFDEESGIEEDEGEEPETACTEEARTCGDGSTVTRNPENGCEFDACPGEEISDEASCEERGGIWGLHHLADEAPTCNEPTSDAGTACTDSSECESYCEAPEGTEADTKVSGTCYAYESASCMQEVKEGTAQPAWCE